MVTDDCRFRRGLWRRIRSCICCKCSE